MKGREVPATGELYHVYNRGVDKRSIFQDEHDIQRFLFALYYFNQKDPVGNLRDILYNKDDFLYRRPTSVEKLVSILAYSLLENHFHLIVFQRIDGGLSEFMKRMAGYTKYFNERHRRSGSLFQGKYKHAHVQSDEYLQFLFAYVNFNHTVHGSSFSFPLNKYMQPLVTSVGDYLLQDRLCDLAMVNTLIDLEQLLENGKKVAQSVHEQRRQAAILLE